MRFIYTEDSLVTLSSIDISPDCTSLLQQSTAPVLAYSTVPVLYTALESVKTMKLLFTVQEMQEGTRYFEWVCCCFFIASESFQN